MPKKESPKGSPKKDKSKSPDKSKKSPKDEGPKEEEIIELALPKGVMHEKVRFVYDESLKADVDFIVGAEGETKTFKVNKCLLVSESPIFQKLVKELEDWKINKDKMETAEEWDKIKHSRPEPPDMELLDHEEEHPHKMADSPGKKDKKGGKGSPPKKDSSPKSKGSKGSHEKGGKKGSPDKGAKKPSPDKKSKDSKKGSPKSKGSPKGKGSPKEEDHEKAPPINKLIDIVVDGQTIRVQDVHPDGFYRLMRYIYYDEIVFNGVIGTIRTLYAARKYLFYDLARACVIYLENHVTLKHVLRLLKASLDFHEDNLLNLCMDLIRNKTFEVINQPQFIYITKEMLNLILEQDILNIREIELFDRVMCWAENRCEDLNIAVTATNQRIALGPYTMTLIRFPTILPHEFAIHIVENGILTNHELIEIMRYHITGNKPDLPYSCVTRRRPYKLPEPDYEALSIVHSNKTEITFVDTFRDRRLRYAISMDDLDILPKRPDIYNKCIETTVPVKSVTSLSDYPLIINKHMYRTTSLPDALNANHYELQLIHYKLHAACCRNFSKEAWYIESNSKDLTVLQPVAENKRRLRHWDFTYQLNHPVLL